MWWQLSTIIGASLVLVVSLRPRLEEPDARPSFVCEEEHYRVRVILYDPFIAHLENFITATESEELIRLARPNLNTSAVLSRNGTSRVSENRRSSTAFLPDDEAVVQCVARRAASLQGLGSSFGIGVQATFYNAGDFVRAHHDVFALDQEDTKTGLTEAGSLRRVTTIFGILEADCVDCGTEFPLLPSPHTSQHLCAYVDCQKPVLTFKPIRNSAVIWRNRFNNGTVDFRVKHAGLPVVDGQKYGFNIWTTHYQSIE